MGSVRTGSVSPRFGGWTRAAGAARLFGVAGRIGNGGTRGASVLATERLDLERFTLADAPFVVELLNDADFLRFIGDKGVRDDESARAYLRAGPLASYERHGFGLWLVRRRSDGAALGTCGLVKRDALDDVDVGFAFLPEHRGQGYAFEAAAAVLAHARDALGLARVVAVAAAGNERSARLLERLGLRFERTVRLAPGTPPARLFTPGDAT